MNGSDNQPITDRACFWCGRTGQRVEACHMHTGELACVDTAACTAASLAQITSAPGRFRGPDDRGAGSAPGAGPEDAA